MSPKKSPATEVDSRIHRAKMPPHDNGAEQAVLGGLMIKNDALDAIEDVLHASDFYRHDHQIIFAAIMTLAGQKKPMDLLTVSDQLRNTGQYEEAGGMVYLANLVDDTPSAANIASYARIVREKSVLRQLIVVGDEITQSAYNPQGQDITELVDSAERKVFRIAEQGNAEQAPYSDINDLLTAAVNRIDLLYKNGDELSGLSTGFTDFDKMTSGLQPAELTIIAARPSMGKTCMAMNIAENVAMNSNETVAIFSLEMSGQSLAARMISSNGRVHQQNINSGRLADGDWPRIASAVSLFSSRKIFIDDHSTLTPAELRARARRIKRDHGLGLIVVDYLQLMHCPGQDNRVNEISAISRGLKAIAKELSVPVVALSQLSRAVEERPNKRPIMSDLRESGAIEQDADVVCMIYRDDYYNKDSKHKGTAEIIIGKQRNGPTGSFRLTFLGEFSRFDNFSPDYYGYEPMEQA